MKLAKNKLAEGRCQGIGATYTPFFTVEEARSKGTATRIPDPIEGRDVHTLSTVETMLYWYIRWDPNVRYIREQYLLDIDRINEIKDKLGMGRSGLYYTTDFLVDYKDGSQRAFSVKWTDTVFDPENEIYKGREQKYVLLINRQNLERIYWESQGVSFDIVTREKLDRKHAANIEFVMGYYNTIRVTETVHKLLYLVAHHFIDVSMDEGYLDPVKLMKETKIDVDATYELAVRLKEKAKEILS